MTIANRVLAEVGTRRKMRRFQRVVERDTGWLDSRFGAAEAAAMRREMPQEYRSLLPGVPDIGGRRNAWSANLTAAVWALAVHQVVRRHGGGAEDTGRVAHDYVQNSLSRIPRSLRHLLLRPRASRWRTVARRSQRRRYPDDWVMDFVDGTDQPFDFGLDITECAIVKYLHAHDADELAPWMCATDHVVLQNAGVGLTRTKTVAWGCDRCDFRIDLRGRTTAHWPPEFAERTCGDPGASDGPPRPVRTR